MINKNVKKLPVVDQGKLVGIFTLTDVAKVEPQIMRAIETLIAKGLAKRFRKYIKLPYIA